MHVFLYGQYIIIMCVYAIILYIHVYIILCIPIYVHIAVCRDFGAQTIFLEICEPINNGVITHAFPIVWTKLQTWYCTRYF